MSARMVTVSRVSPSGDAARVVMESHVSPSGSGVPYLHVCYNHFRHIQNDNLTVNTAGVLNGDQITLFLLLCRHLFAVHSGKRSLSFLEQIYHRRETCTVGSNVW